MSLDPREFRNALGQFATGVCVISANPAGHDAFGMTINSFASVSLDPALVLWSLRNDSECFEAFQAAKGFTVNVLNNGQLDISNRYAKKDNHQLQQADYRIGKSGLPVIRDALTSMECEVWQRYDGGDHQILVGKVIELSVKLTGKPLLFHAGKYAELH